MKSLPLLPRNGKFLSGVKAIALLFATLAIYFQDLIVMANEALHSEIMSYILALPFLLSYLLYRKRKMLNAVIPFSSSKSIRKTILTREIVGAMLCLLAFLLYWTGSYTFYPLEYRMVSLPVFIAGCTLIIFNTQTLKVLAFPIAFLLFLTPTPFEIIYTAGTILSTFSSEAAYTILKIIGLPINLVTRNGGPIIILQRSGGTPLIFAIDLACTGIYSLLGFTIFAVFAAYIARGSIWKKAVIFLIGFPLIYALNITRIIFIVLIGHQFGMEIAMQAFHLFGGWVLIFLGTILLIYLSEKICKTQLFSKKAKMVPCPKCSQNIEKKQLFCPACGRTLNSIDSKISRSDLFRIVALLMSASLIMLLEVPVFALTEGPAEVITHSTGYKQANTQILPQFPGYELQFVYRDKEFEEISRQNASLIYAYIPNSQGTPVWVTIEIADSRAVLHSWEGCLIKWPQKQGRPPQVIQLDLREVQLMQNPPIVGRFFAFEHKKNNLTQVVLYWYENVLFNTVSGIEKKYVKISVIAYGENPENFSEIEDLLLPFGEAIANYWQPVKEWSTMTITISRHGTTLVLITTALLVITLMYQEMKNRKNRESNLRVYKKLSEEDKIILQTLNRAAEKGETTGKAAASFYQKISHRNISLDSFLEKLNQAEEAGLVKREIVNRDDEPVLIWKNQLPF